MMADEMNQEGSAVDDTVSAEEIPTSDCGEAHRLKLMIEMEKQKREKLLKENARLQLAMSSRDFNGVLPQYLQGNSSPTGTQSSTYSTPYASPHREKSQPLVPYQGNEELGDSAEVRELLEKREVLQQEIEIAVETLKKLSTIGPPSWSPPSKGANGATPTKDEDGQDSQQQQLTPGSPGRKINELRIEIDVENKEIAALQEQLSQITAEEEATSKQHAQAMKELTERKQDNMKRRSIALALLESTLNNVCGVPKGERPEVSL